MNFQDIKALDESYVLQTYGRNQVAIDHGKGASLWDTEGKQYIDFTSGIGVCSLGYANEAWAKAIYDQAMKVGHIPICSTPSLTPGWPPSWSPPPEWRLLSSATPARRPTRA